MTPRGPFQPCHAGILWFWAIFEDLCVASGPVHPILYRNEWAAAGPLVMRYRGVCSSAAEGFSPGWRVLEADVQNGDFSNPWRCQWTPAWIRGIPLHPFKLSGNAGLCPCSWTALTRGCWSFGFLELVGGYHCCPLLANGWQEGSSWLKRTSRCALSTQWGDRLGTSWAGHQWQGRRTPAWRTWAIHLMPEVMLPLCQPHPSSLTWSRAESPLLCCGNGNKQPSGHTTSGRVCPGAADGSHGDCGCRSSSRNPSHQRPEVPVCRDRACPPHWRAPASETSLGRAAAGIVTLCGAAAAAGERKGFAELPGRLYDLLVPKMELGSARSLQEGSVGSLLFPSRWKAKLAFFKPRNNLLGEEWGKNKWKFNSSITAFRHHLLALPFGWRRGPELCGVFQAGGAQLLGWGSAGTGAWWCRSIPEASVVTPDTSLRAPGLRNAPLGSGGSSPRWHWTWVKFPQLCQHSAAGSFDPQHSRCGLSSIGVGSGICSRSQLDLSRGSLSHLWVETVPESAVGCLLCRTLALLSLLGAGELWATQTRRV